METKQKSLPSEKLQKEFEDNPLKILENIRNEKEEQLDEPIASKNDINSNSNSNESSLPNETNISFKKEKNENNFEGNIDFKTKKNFLKNVNKKMSNKDGNSNVNFNVNFNVNNLNIIDSNYNKTNCENNFINYNSNSHNNINSDSNNISVNNLFLFNFNTINHNTDYVNNNSIKNYECKNNTCLRKNSEEANSTSSQSNDDDNKNNSNNSNNSNNNNTTNNISNIGINSHNNIITQKNKYKLLILSDINILLDNLKTFKGSIVSQEFIDNLNDEKDLIILFNNILPHICTIMCLEYGNYFFQKFLKKLNIKQKLIIYQIIEPNFYIIAANKFGTHSIQSLINNIESQYELLALSQLISKNMYFLFINNNSYHIIMKIILDFPEEQRHFLNLFLVLNVEKIIINCNGAFCVNKFIINNKDLKLRALLIQNLKNHIKQLIFNKYCCINLLLILEKFGIEWGRFIIKEIQENFESLCEHPVSNLFINKVLLFLNNNYLFDLKVFLWSLYKNIVLMKNLISNKNNNNIINQLISLSDEDQKKYLLLLLNSNGNL
jgi:hypothetical protein